MKDNGKCPAKFISYYDIDRGADPYPFMVITMGASQSDEWESFVHEVKDDADLRNLVKKHALHASVVYAALRSLYPVRFGNHFMFIPVKNQFFEVFVPFDG